MPQVGMIRRVYNLVKVRIISTYYYVRIVGQRYSYTGAIYTWYHVPMIYTRYKLLANDPPRKNVGGNYCSTYIQQQYIDTAPYIPQCIEF